MNEPKSTRPFDPQLATQASPRGEEWVQQQLDNILGRAHYQAMIWAEREQAAKQFAERLRRAR